MLLALASDNTPRRESLFWQADVVEFFMSVALELTLKCTGNRTGGSNPSLSANYFNFKFRFRLGAKQNFHSPR